MSVYQSLQGSIEEHTAAIWDSWESVTSLLDHIVRQGIKHITLDIPFPTPSVSQDFLYSKLLSAKSPFRKVLEQSSTLGPTSDVLNIHLPLASWAGETELDGDNGGRTGWSGRHDDVGVE